VAIHSSVTSRTSTTRSAKGSRRAAAGHSRELPDDTAEIESSGLFEHVTVRQFDWEISYGAEDYIRLLDTFSGHIAMDTWKRDRLYSEIRRRLAERPDGRLRRHWGAVLQVGRRRTAAN
jgi:hypothetical protein